MTRLGILISGRGSNFEAIADSIAAGAMDASIAVVVGNRPEARGLEMARQRGLNAVCIRSLGLDREVYDRMLLEELRQHGVELVCLAGFMRLLSATFIREYPNRILNIHPSLLPAFPGLDAQRQALEHGVKITGCTVHFVDEYLDAGPIIIQSAVPVMEPQYMVNEVLPALKYSAAAMETLEGMPIPPISGENDRLWKPASM